MTRVTRIVLALVAISCIALAWYAAAQNLDVQQISAAGTFITLSIVAAQIVGWLITSRDPREWVGSLVQLTGLVGALGVARQADLGIATLAIARVWMGAVLVPALLLLVSLRALSRPRLLVLVVAIATNVVLGEWIVGVAGTRHASPLWWWTEPTSTASSRAMQLFAVNSGVVTVALLGVCAVLGREYLGAWRPARRLVRPVVGAGLAWALITLAGQLVSLAEPTWAHSTDGLTIPGMFLLVVGPLLSIAAIIAAVVWVELVVPRLAWKPSGLTARSSTDDRDVQRFLARGLGDPSVRVLFLASSGAGWVDYLGRPANLPTDDPERALTFVRRAGAVFGAIDHDASLADQPETIELIATGPGLALENERLLALARARTDEAARLAARLGVTASESAREDLRRALADGPDRLLAEIEAALFDEATLVDLSERLATVAADVRRISHGVFPAGLSSGGLREALPLALEVPDQRFPPGVEITVYLAAAGDPTARLAVVGDRLVIRLAAPPVGRVLLDRLDVLGARMIDSTIEINVGVSRE